MGNEQTARKKKLISINLDEDVIEYFKKMSEQVGIPYQTLMNNYLRYCMVNRRRIEINWD